MAKKKIKIKNPYPKYSYNSGLVYLYSNKPVYGIDNKWLMWEISHGYGLSRI